MTQNAKNHSRFFPAFHFVVVPLTLIGLGLSIYQVTQNNTLLSWLVVLLFFLMVFALLFARSFPLKVQDRVIRTEENLRHFFITGKPLPSQLQLPQIIALRFAGDDEFVALTNRVAKENLSPQEIKEAIKNWRADDYRI